MLPKPATRPGLDQRPLGSGAGFLAVVVILGPVLMREGGYAFDDSWTRGIGRSRGYVYHRIEDAHYARKAEILHAGDIVACNTVDEFARATTALVHPPDTSVKAERRRAFTFRIV
jgi:hypothetical protein